MTVSPRSVPPRRDVGWPRTAGGSDVDTVEEVPTARLDIVDMCLEHDIDGIVVRGPDAQTTAAALTERGVIATTSTATPQPFVLWLADAVSARTVPRLASGCLRGGVVLVEATLPPTGIGLVPVLVEVDRAALVTFDGRTVTRFDVAGGRSRPRPISPRSLSDLDAEAAAQGLSLVARWADSGGMAFGDGRPAHLSWFRNEVGEPERAPGPSHRPDTHGGRR